MNKQFSGYTFALPNKNIVFVYISMEIKIFFLIL